MRSRPALTAADVQKMMAACKAEAQKNKWNVTIAIVDDSGAALLLERMDGAGPISAEVAMGKARTSALTQAPDQVLGRPRQGAAGVRDLPAPACMFQGGLPLMHQGDCVGAIGVSGVQSHEDEQIAQAGVDRAGVAAAAVPGAAQHVVAVRCRPGIATDTGFASGSRIPAHRVALRPRPRTRSRLHLEALVHLRREQVLRLHPLVTARPARSRTAGTRRASCGWRRCRRAAIRRRRSSCMRRANS